MKKHTDKRYTIHLEFCGNSEQKHVLRFCGDFMKAHDTAEQAEKHALQAIASRSHVNEGYAVLSDHNDGEVTLLKSSCYSYRVVYGAFAVNKSTLSSALDEYQDCVKHALNCAGIE